VSDRSGARLAVLGVLAFSLIVTLIARVATMQVIAPDQYVAAASDNRVRTIVTPAVRGLVLDQAGRPLVGNRTSLVVSVDPNELARQPDKGKAVLTRLAQALGMSYSEVADRTETCGPKARAKPPICWNGSAYQPIPIARDVPTDTALRIMERRVEYPGVEAQLEAVRDYRKPFGVNAAGILGYLGPVSDAELEAAKERSGAGDDFLLQRTDLVGRAGVEQSYEADLRGIPGVKTVAVDRRGVVVGTVDEKPAEPGGYLVTNIDAKLQAVVEQQLQAAIDRARGRTDKQDAPYVADSGAAVVLDTTNGHVLAMASYPSYDPEVWVGGISSQEYNDLLDPKKGTPLVQRAIAGQYAPGSTFKVISATAAMEAGFSTNDTYPCGPSYTAGNRTFKNYESESFGDISLAKALEVSCNTVFYDYAYRMWLADGGTGGKPGEAKEWMAKEAKAFGLGQRTGIDLPGEARGQIVDRQGKIDVYNDLKDAKCKRAEAGYPELTDRARARLLQEYAKDFCDGGAVYQSGDALNFAIGQGDTVLTPLQLASVYASIANGGTIYQPQVARGVVSPDGSTVRTIKPKVNGKAPLTAFEQQYLVSALRSVTENPQGTAYNAFNGFPLGQIPVAAKTGSAQVLGKQSTSWFATFAPADKPKYAVVMMVTQGGTGAGTSAPSVRKIYESIFGITGEVIDPAKSVFANGSPTQALPAIAADGTPVPVADDGFAANGAPQPPVLPSATPTTLSAPASAGRRRRARQ